MQLPAIKKMFYLPRSSKVLFLSLIIIVIFILAAEVIFYFRTSKSKADEAKYINTDVAYQEGVFLHDKTTKERIAVRGWVTKIDGLFLTVENRGQETVVEMVEDFEYVNISEEPKKISQKDLEKLRSRNKYSESQQEALKELAEKGLIVMPESSEVENLAKLVNIGDFVVVSKIEMSRGKIKGSFLSILEFLR